MYMYIDIEWLIWLRSHVWITSGNLFNFMGNVWIAEGKSLCWTVPYFLEIDCTFSQNATRGHNTTNVPLATPFGGFVFLFHTQGIYVSLYKAYTWIQEYWESREYFSSTALFNSYNAKFTHKHKDQGHWIIGDSSQLI